MERVSLPQRVGKDGPEPDVAFSRVDPTSDASSQNCYHPRSRDRRLRSRYLRSQIIANESARTALSFMSAVKVGLDLWYETSPYVYFIVGVIAMLFSTSAPGLSAANSKPATQTIPTPKSIFINPPGHGNQIVIRLLLITPAAPLPYATRSPKTTGL